MRSWIVALCTVVLTACSSSEGNGPVACPASVDDGNACTVDACDPATGQVTHDSSAASDGDPCTVDLCDPSTGVTVHSPVPVEDGDLCTVDACDPGTGVVSHTPVPVGDGDACTVDTCSPASGIVSHGPVSPDDGDPCTVDACDPASGVSNLPVDPSDGIACTADACDAGAGISHTPVDATCDDANQCTTETCDAALGCRYAYLDSTATAVLAGELPGTLHVVPMMGLPLDVTGTGFTATVCPAGPSPGDSPPTCTVEEDFAAASLTFEALPDGTFRASGEIPLRVARVPVDGTAVVVSFSGWLTFTGNAACDPPQTFGAVPVTVAVRVDAAPGDALEVVATADPTAVSAGLAACGSGLASFATFLRGTVTPYVVEAVEAQVVAQVEEQLCLPPPCPGGSADVGGLCRYGGGLCVARGLHPATGMLVVPACAQ